MYGISPTVLIALAGLTVVALFLLTPLGTRKPKRAEKWEKAEIMRKLLALSENEPGMAKVPVARSRITITRPVSGRTPTRPASVALKGTSKTSLPARSKAR